MKVKRFSNRLPQEVIKHLEEAGDNIEIINLFESNNRTVVYYTEKPVRTRKPKVEKETNHG